QRTRNSVSRRSLNDSPTAQDLPLRHLPQARTSHHCADSATWRDRCRNGGSPSRPHPDCSRVGGFWSNGGVRARDWQAISSWPLTRNTENHEFRGSERRYPNNHDKGSRIKIRLGHSRVIAANEERILGTCPHESASSPQAL